MLNTTLRAPKILTLLFALFCYPLASVGNSNETEATRPNILIIIVDDLGWKDVGYNGGEISTPNIDELAHNGIKLERFYSQPYCTATRASLMTGQSPIRIGIEGPFLVAGDAHLPLDLKLLPEYLRDIGYQTALSGKWHLGHVHKAALPMARGFEQAYGSLSGGLGYWDHTSGGGYDWHRNQITLREEGYTTHLIAKEAVRIIEQRDTNKPLFLYTAFNAPHLPNEAPPETINKYEHIQDPNRRVHAAMVDELDQAIGRIIAALNQQKMAENTLIWFLSDNGGTTGKGRMGMGKAAHLIQEYFGKPAPTRLLELIRMANLDGGSDNGPYKGGKGQVSEGGVLVPAIVSWPQTLQSRSIQERVTVQDIFPTIAAFAGLSNDSEQIVDGADQSSLFKGSTPEPPKDFVIGNAEKEAYYMDQWKLVRDRKSGMTQLFDLTNDPYENLDLSSKKPNITSELLGRLDAYPRGDRVNIPRYKLFLTPESWGGREYREPWADSAR